MSSICHLLWYKYYYHGSFPGTNVIPLSMGLGKEVKKMILSLKVGINWPQCTTDTDPYPWVV